MSAAPILKVYQDGAEVRSVSLKEDAWIGRDEGCIVRLSDRAISRRHLLLKPLSNGVQIEKKSKFSPLFVNGVEKEQAFAKAGDVISIGPYLVKFEFPESVTSTITQSAEIVSSESTDLHEAASLSMPSSPTPAIASPTDLASIFPEPVESPQIETEQPITGMAEPSISLLAENDADKTAVFDSESLHLNQQEEMALAAGPVEALPSYSVEEVHSQVSNDHNVTAVTPAQPINSLGESPTFSLSGQSIESAPTKVVSTSKVAAVIEIPDGMANVKELVIDQDEISIGRGQECNVVLNDKKSSRKHAIICRQGIRFMIKDLKSMNGTFVDGEKVTTEKELSTEHTIKIGEVTFQFRTFNTDYMKDEADFLKMPEYVASAVTATGNEQTGATNAAVNFAAPAMSAMGAEGVVTAQPEFIPPPVLPSSQSGSLVDRFKRYPPLMKGIVILLLVMVGVLLLSDLEEEPVKKTKSSESQKAVATQNPAQPDQKPSATFETLPEETKKLIQSQHLLAFEHLKNKEYDKALFEIRKIFQYIPDYQDAREIERYSLEGKRKLEAMEEEKKRKEEEARIKERVNNLSKEIISLMQSKNFPQARELITELLTLDPEGEDTQKLKNELARVEDESRTAAENAAIQAQLLSEAWKRYRVSLANQRAEKWRDAFRGYQSLLDFGVQDKKLLGSIRARMRETKDAIRAIYDPLLEEAAQMEGAGETRKAYDTYMKAKNLDPSRREARNGMERIHQALHEHAKASYTEAVLAESYSDFAVARAKYEEVLKNAPENDMYRERAQRKLKGYFIKRETASQ